MCDETPLAQIPLQGCRAHLARPTSSLIINCPLHGQITSFILLYFLLPVLGANSILIIYSLLTLNKYNTVTIQIINAMLRSPFFFFPLSSHVSTIYCSLFKLNIISQASLLFGGFHVFSVKLPSHPPGEILTS